MNAKMLYDNLLSFLQVTFEPRDISGYEIQVNETFTLRVRVKNVAPSGCHNPNISFTNVRVRVAGTQYAEPEAASTVTLNLNDAVLSRGGDDGFVDVPFVAKQAIFDAFGTIPGIAPEKIADVRVTADVDQNALFRLCQDMDAYVDIVTN